MPTMPPEISSEAIAARAKGVHDTDSIWALEGFTKTPTIRELDAAYVAGRITATQKLAVVQLDARLIGARSVLAALPENDPRRAVISERLVEQTEELRHLAQGISSALVRALGLL